MISISLAGITAVEKRISKVFSAEDFFKAWRKFNGVSMIYMEKSTKLKLNQQQTMYGSN